MAKFIKTGGAFTVALLAIMIGWQVGTMAAPATVKKKSIQVAPVPQFASDHLSLFGVEVGQSYAPEAIGCEFAYDPSIKISTHKPKAGQQFCLYKEEFPIKPDIVAIQFANLLPEPFYNSARVRIGTSSNGQTIIRSISFTTQGIQSQNELMAAFSAKFGRPQRQNVEQLQNLAGAKFDSVHAEWDFKDGSILEFSGTAGKADLGSFDGLSADALREFEANKPKRQAL